MMRMKIHGSGRAIKAEVISCLLLLWLLTLATGALAQDINKLVSVTTEGSPDAPLIILQTAEPVGYRYTVYDSQEPTRVVVDFPAMDMSGIEPEITVSKGAVKEVRVANFDLESGKLGRVEIVLEEATAYAVNLTEKRFAIQFGNQGQEQEGASSSGTAVSEVSAIRAEKSEQQHGTLKIQGPTGTEVSFISERTIAKHQYFNLENPARLVVDVYGMAPGFEERSFTLTDGFRRMRIGTYPDKTRFVFDGRDGVLPTYRVMRKGNRVVVSWGEKPESGNASGKKQQAAVSKPDVTQKSTQKPKKKKSTVQPVTKFSSIEALDFEQRDGQSIFSAIIDGPADVIKPIRAGQTVTFGVRGVTMPHHLRRSFDATGFPSAVKLVTPYYVNGRVPEVRFAVELKGDVPYRIQRHGDRLELSVTDGRWGGQPVAGDEKRILASSSGSDTAQPVVVAGQPVKQSPAAVLQKSTTLVSETIDSDNPLTAAGLAQSNQQFSGEKITLIFDSAEVRQILQLIGDVSNLNIIASEGVGGTITLRLIEVPWDQALNLIMDIKDLGMIREGNIARIMPRDRIRQLREAKLTAKRTEERLEDLVTEVISVSYTALGNIAAPVRELLTERGKLTEDTRNKQIIVTDIPAVLVEAKNLVKILDTPERQVMIEARIVEADSSFSMDLGVKWGFNYENSGGGSWDTSKAGIGLGGAFLIDPPSVGSVGDAGLGSGITFGRVGIDSAVLDLRISALETSGHGKVISTPRVATLNGESAKISQGTSIPYQTVSDGGTNTEFVDASLSLEVTPIINPDNSVILEIKAANSSPGSTVATGAGAAPSIDTKEAETKVLVHDGDTTVIGGIFVENEDHGQQGVPLLGDIPILGHLFKSTTTTMTRAELLIFITPRIVR